LVVTVHGRWNQTVISLPGFHPRLNHAFNTEIVGLSSDLLIAQARTLYPLIAGEFFVGLDVSEEMRSGLLAFAGDAVGGKHEGTLNRIAIPPSQPIDRVSNTGIADTL
jgi:hypothetical protein